MSDRTGRASTAQSISVLVLSTSFLFDIYFSVRPCRNWLDWQRAFEQQENVSFLFLKHCLYTAHTRCYEAKGLILHL